LLTLRDLSFYNFKWYHTIRRYVVGVGAERVGVGKEMDLEATLFLGRGNHMLDVLDMP
jgi:hypothetical protein